MVKEVNSAEFESALATSSVVVLKVGAPWCAACKAIAPAVEKIAEENTEVKFYDINADKNVDYVMGLGIRSLPTFVFFKDGERVSIEKGLTEQALKQKLNDLAA